MAQNGTLPQKILRDALHCFGYGDEHIETNWPFLDLEALKAGKSTASPLSLAIAAFNHERRRDWSTSALICDLSRPEVVGNAGLGAKHCRFLFDATAAPTILLANHDTADLWVKCWTPTPQRISGIGFDVESLKREFANQRENVERQALARLRGGQQFLFDSVYDAGRDQLAVFLHTGLVQAEKKLLEQIPGKSKEANEERARCEERLSHVAMALLAARIFEDKNYFGSNETQTLDARKLLRRAESKSNGFFRRVISDDLAGLDQRLGKDAVDDMLQRIMAHLTGPACFSLITPEMLGDLYERALVANGRRGGKVNLKGIHYTPLSLAKHILRRIPIEELPPSRRHVLDMACGSGSFLLAATSRLRDAFDADEADAEESVGEHLRSHVFGNDKDDIAVLVAKMRYLLTHWIEYGSADDVPMPTMSQGDGLVLSSSLFGAVAPSVIVGNPPFQPHGSDQLANCFLRKAIELLAPGGFLGMIMPGAFLKMIRQNGPETRKQLTELCELLEVWELPEHVVGIAAEQPVCVVVARKKDQPIARQGAVIFKSVSSRHADSVSAYRDHLRATWTFMANGMPGRDRIPWSKDPMRRIIASPIDRVWQRLDLSRTLGDLCGENIGQGINAIGPNAEFSNLNRDGFEPYLQHQERLRPFFLETHDWKGDATARGRYVKRGTGLWPKEKLWPLYHGLKVLMRGRTHRDGRLQTVAAFDDSGVFPENDFRCLTISDELSGMPDWARNLVSQTDRKDLLIWVAAIMNSAIAQAWIAMCSTRRGILEETLSKLPVPDKYDPRIVNLVLATKKVKRPEKIEQEPIWSLWSEQPPQNPGQDFQTLAGQINRLMFLSYGLSEDDFQDVKKYLEGMTDPWVEGAATAHILQGPIRCITGKVVSVNVADQTVCLDLPRYSRKTGGPLDVALPSDMPGWALREGVEFTCNVPKELTDPSELRSNPWLLRDFRPLPYSYLSPKQIRELVASRSITGMAEG